MKTYRPYDPNQKLKLPPLISDWLPESHLAHFINDLVETLDLRSIFQSYEQGDLRGQPPYHPRMMVKLLFYAYCNGKLSSRKIERATYEDVAYRMLAMNQHPDHASIAEFRKRHLKALAGLFLQVLEWCRAAGLVKLGHVALDGTKIKANASKHKAMSYGRMEETEQRLMAEIEAILKEAEAADAAEEEQHGSRRGDELPEELQRRTSRLEKIREAKEALEAEARERAVEAAAAAAAKIAERERKEIETGKKTPGRKPQVPEVEGAKPDPKAQRNFTDPESKIMKDGASQSFEQAYNAQAVVDQTKQIIVAYDLVDEANDKKQLALQLEQVEANTGRKPEEASADAGYFSEAAITDERLLGIDLYVAPDRQKHGQGAPAESAPAESAPAESAPAESAPAESAPAESAPAESAPAESAPAESAPAESAPAEGAPAESVTGEQTHEGRPIVEASVTEQMRDKLKTPAGRAAYGKRKGVVEPVFGQIKEGRGIRRFSFRGLEKVKAEWGIICLTHNLLKLHRSSVAGRIAQTT